MTAERVDRSLLKDPGHLIAFGLGSGLLPGAPGTWGSLASIPLVWAVGSLTLMEYLLVTAVLFVLGTLLAGRTAKALGVHDHPSIVIDEVVGMLVTCAAVTPNWSTIVLGFVLFRVFDILKPWPIRVIDRRCGGGIGIMLDDLLAGCLAGLLLWTLQHWLLNP